MYFVCFFFLKYLFGWFLLYGSVINYVFKIIKLKMKNNLKNFKNYIIWNVKCNLNLGLIFYRIDKWKKNFCNKLVNFLNDFWKWF